MLDVTTPQLHKPATPVAKRPQGGAAQPAFRRPDSADTFQLRFAGEKTTHPPVAETPAEAPATPPVAVEEDPLQKYHRESLAEIRKLLQQNANGTATPESNQKAFATIKTILAKEIEKKPPIEFNGDAMRLLRNLTQIHHVHPFKDSFFLPLTMQLCSKDGVTAYMKSQGLNPNTIYDAMDRVYNQALKKGSHSKATVEDIREIVHDIQKFAHKEGLERVSDVTIWRWLVNREDPQLFFEKALSQGGVQKDMIERIKKAPNTEKNNLNMEEIPDRPTPEEIAKLDEALNKLPKKVIGQQKALEKMLDTYETSKLGYNTEKDKPFRPKVRQLLLGPSGVGKTFAVEQLAKVLGRPLIYVPLNEFIEDNSVNRFTGAPPGYTGYGDGNSVADQIIRAREEHITKGTPLPIVLFDEIEKASPKVFDVLMQVLDKGLIHNGTGEAAYFKGIDVFMTSNIAQKKIAEAKDSGKDDEHIKGVVDGAMKEHFRPEFIGRIDEPVIFETLEREDAGKILDLNLKGLKGDVEGQDKIQLTIEPSMREAILDEGYQKEYGVRRLKDMMEAMLHRKLVKVRKYLIRNGMLDGENRQPITVTARFDLPAADAKRKQTVLEVNGKYLPEIFESTR